MAAGADAAEGDAAHAAEAIDSAGCRREPRAPVGVQREPLSDAEIAQLDDEARIRARLLQNEEEYQKKVWEPEMYARLEHEHDQLYNALTRVRQKPTRSESPAASPGAPVTPMLQQEDVAAAFPPAKPRPGALTPQQLLGFDWQKQPDQPPPKPVIPPPKPGEITRDVTVDLGGAKPFTLIKSNVEGERARLIKNLDIDLKLVEDHTQICRDAARRFLEEWPIMRRIADFAAGATPPSMSIWYDVDEQIRKNRDAIARGDLEGATEGLQVARKFLRNAQATWARYKDANLGGAETVLHGAETTRRHRQVHPDRPGDRRLRRDGARRRHGRGYRHRRRRRHGPRGARRQSRLGRGRRLGGPPDRADQVRRPARRQVVRQPDEEPRVPEG